MHDRLAALGLGKQHRVRAACHNRIQIGVGHAGVEPVDAHQQARALLLSVVRFEKFQRGGARLLFALGRNRIFQVDDDAVGAGGKRLAELGAAVGGDEEKGAHREPRPARA